MLDKLRHILSGWITLSAVLWVVSFFWLLRIFPSFEKFSLRKPRWMSAIYNFQVALTLRWFFKILKAKVSYENFGSSEDLRGAILAADHTSWLETSCLPSFLPEMQVVSRRGAPLWSVVSRWHVLQLDLTNPLASMRFLVKKSASMEKELGYTPPILIFPAGTRGGYDKLPHYNGAGLYALYKSFDGPVYPLVNNLAFFFSSPKTIFGYKKLIGQEVVFRLLEPIEPYSVTKFSRKELMERYVHLMKKGRAAMYRETLKNQPGKRG